MSILAFKDAYSTTSINLQGLALYYTNKLVLAFKDIHCTPSINSSHLTAIKQQKDFQMPKNKLMNNLKLII
jgi:hypothetical protein